MDEASINRRFIIVIVVFAVALVALGGWFFLQYQEYRTLSTEIEASTGIMQAKKTELSSLEIDERKIESNRKTAEKFEAYLPGDEDIPGMLRQIADLAYKSSLRLDTASVTTPAAKTGPGQAQALYDTRIFKIDIVGTYPDIVMFINQVESLNRFVMIHTMKIAPEQGKGESDKTDLFKPQQLACSLLIYTFIYTGVK